MDTEATLTTFLKDIEQFISDNSDVNGGDINEIITDVAPNKEMKDIMETIKNMHLIKMKMNSDTSN
tara:strand:+ start:224 stop:421 length:198 start_codon:yes stop_codon:yes gene_type:complete